MSPISENVTAKERQDLYNLSPGSLLPSILSYDVWALEVREDNPVNSLSAMGMKFTPAIICVNCEDWVGCANTQIAILDMFNTNHTPSSPMALDITAAP